MTANTNRISVSVSVSAAGERSPQCWGGDYLCCNSGDDGVP